MTHTLTIEPLGESVEVEEEQTLLDAALRQGIWMPHACGHGLCSSCKVDVLEGEVDHGEASPFALMDFEREAGKALACCAIPRTDVVIEADIEEEEDALYLPVADFEGRVTRLEMLTPDILGIWLEVEGFDFQAGQYVNVHVPGVEGPRAFSVASSPADPSVVELHVKRVPGGKATTWLHENLKEGDELRFSGPYGQFFVRASIRKPRIFVAGGSGLSSIRSMVLDLLEEGLETDIFLFHGARTEADLHYADAFRALAADEPRFSYVPALSLADGDAPWSGERGYVNEAMERHFDGRFSGHQAYLCGPPPMVEACIRSLMKGRLFERDIFTEKFVTAADAEAAVAKSPVFKRI